MILRYSLLVFIAISTAACASRTTVRHSADFQSAIAMSNHEVTIMPPVAEVNMIDIAAKKSRMFDYEYHLEDILVREVIPTLQAQGLRAKLIRRKDLHDQNLAEDAGRLRSRYKEAIDQLYKEIQWEEKKAFDITNNTGPFSLNIATHTQSDLLVMIDYARNVKTSGARTRDLLMDIAFRTGASDEADKSVLIIGIIDAKTGKILWTNLGVDMSSVLGSSLIDNLSSEEKLASKRIKSILSTIFKNFNKQEKK